MPICECGHPNPPGWHGCDICGPTQPPLWKTPLWEAVVVVRMLRLPEETREGVADWLTKRIYDIGWSREIKEVVVESVLMTARKEGENG